MMWEDVWNLFILLFDRMDWRGRPGNWFLVLLCLVSSSSLLFVPKIFILRIFSSETRIPHSCSYCPMEECLSPHGYHSLVLNSCCYFDPRILKLIDSIMFYSVIVLWLFVFPEHIWLSWYQWLNTNKHMHVTCMIKCKSFALCCFPFLFLLLPYFSST